MTLYHFTCDHGRQAIGKAGLIRPNRRAMVPVAWFTDLPDPDALALGLTSILLSCDRLAHRYRVTDARDVVPWAEFDAHPDIRVCLESAPGVRPDHWFVASRPVPARLALGRLT